MSIPMTRVTTLGRSFFCSKTTSKYISYFSSSANRLKTFQFRVLLAVSLGALWNTAVAVTAPIGTTSGSFSVTPTGAATYSIPITVPPGTNAMAPKFSLNYTSQGGNGLLGIGWSIDGLSVIHRCAPTLAVDGVKGGVDYSSNDRYCVDGQRLISVGGSEYRTQHESWNKITALGTAGSGPASFIVKTKNGMTMEYGMTIDSRIEAQGRADVRIWALNKIQDQNGNYLTISYTEDNLNGDYRPALVSYTGNDTLGLAAYNSIVFDYEARTDQDPDYIGGSVIKITQRLKTITVQSGASIVRSYNFSYDNAGYQGQTRLTSLSECADGVCLPSTSFSWQAAAGSSGFSSPIPWSYGNGGVLADVNGDGRDDLVRIDLINQGESGTLYVSLSTANGFSATQNWGSFSISSCMDGLGGPCKFSFGDVNGDGKADLVAVGSYTFVGLSTGSGFSSPVQWGSGNGCVIDVKGGSGNGCVVDVNGDGRDDYAGIALNNEGTGGPIYVSLSTSTGFTPTQVWGSYFDQMCADGAGGSCKFYFGDVNGDGKADFLASGGSGVRMELFTPPTIDLLKTITNGFGASISVTYKKLNDTSVHIASTNSIYPYRDVSDDSNVVSTAATSDGIGGTVTTTYTYGGAKKHVAAETFLGFQWVQSVDPSGLVNVTNYNQVLDGTEGTVASTETFAGSIRVKYSANSWSPVNLGGARTTSRLTSNVEQSRELNNAVVTTLTTTYSNYDAYENPGTIVIDFNDGHRKITTNTYNNDTVNWVLSQLILSQVTAEAPGQVSQTRTSSFTYDVGGRVESEVIEPNNAALKLTTTYGYDSFGNRTSKTVSGADILTRTESQVYDTRGQFPVSKTNALGHTETYVHDTRFGTVASQTGPNGLTTSWSYDGFGRKIGETRADGTTTTINYKCSGGAPPCATLTGYATQLLASGAGESWVFFDIFGRETRTARIGFDGIWSYTDTDYDNLGRKTKVSLPDFSSTPVHYTTYTYDILGRVLTATAPGNRVTTTNYNGLTTTATNPKNQSLTTVKNSQGKVVQATDAGGTTSYLHDPQGNLIRVTDVSGNVVAMTYDIRGRKTSMNDPDMGAWTYAYNVLGELTSQTDAKGQTITMAYDKLGRMTSRVLPNSEGTSVWTYDTAFKGIGKLASVSNPNATETYTYDNLGRLSTVDTSIGGAIYTFTTTYDVVGRVNTLTYPETGFSLRHVYDSNQFGFLKEVVNAVTGESYWKINPGGVDASNRIVNETFGNGLTGLRQYDPATGNLISIKTGTAANAGSVQNLEYSFDAVGNLLTRTDSIQGYTETFAYDEDGLGLNRLTSVSGPSPKTFQYAPNGNLIYKSDVGNYTYPTNGVRPHAVSSVAGTLNATYTYDLNGNMLSGDGRTITYTSFNKPKTIAKGGSTSTFTYDANLNRIIKTTSSNSTIYIGKLYERVTSGTTTEQKHYIYAGPNLVGTYTGPGGTNTPPTANAGADQTVTGGASVSLSGSGSDADGTIASYAWTQLTGPAVTLTGANTATASFTAPSVATTTVLTFKLTVLDNMGSPGSDMVDITVTSSGGGGGSSPYSLLLSTSPDRSNSVAFNGATVSGNIYVFVTPDTGITQVRFYIDGNPQQTENYSPYDLGSTEASGAALPYSTTQLSDGVHSVSAEIDRDTGATDIIISNFAVANNSANAPPTANAGPDQSVVGGTAVSLPGSGSDPDGTIVGYSWTQLTGPAVTLTGANSATASFTAPSVSTATVLTFQLTVTDNMGAPGSDTVDITVNSATGGGNSLQNGVPISGISGAAGAQLYYTLDVPTGATNLSFQISGGTGDADLYVKYGSPPSTTTYDCRPYVGGNNETCTMPSATAGTWHVMIHAYTAFSGTTLVASYTAAGGTGPTGTILREYWQGIPGELVSDLTSNPAYPNSPSGSSQLTSFEAPIDWADNYGTRVRGYVHAPQTGQYVFWISGDDYSELYLSGDDNPANKVLIASVPGWSNSRDWYKYAEQQSTNYVSISLDAGQRYYIEALQKEGGGGDNLAVAWQLPDGTFEGPIPGARLSPAAGGAPPAGSPYTLLLSTNADRTNPVAFEGATVSGNIYVFVNPDTGITQVRFYIDGNPQQTENNAPYDLGGTEAWGAAFPYDSILLGDGAHVVTAEIDRDTGSTDVISASFTVANSSARVWPSQQTADPILLAALVNINNSVTRDGLNWLTTTAAETNANTAASRLTRPLAPGLSPLAATPVKVNSANWDVANATEYNIPLVFTNNQGVSATYYVNVKVQEVQTGSMIGTVRYFHTDHLGSVDTITDETGAVAQRLSYDAWGKRRNANGTDAASITAQTTRGYTRHEHDDEIKLINMNAREYDPLLGRFISPDTIVQFPHSSQGLNRYAYVNNNPLSYTDPTGHRSWRNLFRAAVAIAAIYFTYNGQLTNFAMDVGKAGFGSAKIGIGLVRGGIIGFVAGGTAKSTFAGAFSGALFGKVGDLGLSQWASPAVHAITGGFSSGLMGGDFRSGALGAGFSELAGNLPYANNLVVRTMVGGLSAELTGGQFKYGAWTAAYAYLFSQASAPRDEKLIDGIKVYRQDISLKSADGTDYGHWWIEIDGKESYGWWPKGQVGLMDTLFGTEGELNRMSRPGGSPTLDPHHGDYGRVPGVNAFDVYGDLSVSKATYVDQIRAYANSYSGSWSWPFGQNCHSFQEGMLNKLGLTVRPAGQ